MLIYKYGYIKDTNVRLRLIVYFNINLHPGANSSGANFHRGRTIRGRIIRGRVVRGRMTGGEIS